MTWTDVSMKMNINNIQGAIFMGYMVDKMRNMSFRQYSFEKKLRDIEAEMSGRNIVFAGDYGC